MVREGMGEYCWVFKHICEFVDELMVFAETTHSPYDSRDCEGSLSGVQVPTSFWLVQV